MQDIDYEKVLNEFSNESIKPANYSEDDAYRAYMINKTDTIYFVRVYDSVGDRLSTISVYHYINDLPSSIYSNEKMLSTVCNNANLAMDNGTTVNYIADDEKSFITVKSSNVFLSDAAITSNKELDMNFMVKMCLYTSIIEISKTVGFINSNIKSGGTSR